jgi:hypothetical protein
MKITLDEFCSHWVRGAQFMPMASRFDYNVCNFTTAVGDHTKQFFQNSFDASGFYGSGAKWKPRESKWGKKYTHPVLIDTGMLKKSIRSESKEVSIKGRRTNGTRIQRQGAKYFIWTEEISTPTKGKRGKKKGLGRYAAVHNSDPRLTNFTVNQYSSRKPVQRQFIGFSQRLDAELTQYTPMLFKGFPFPL